MSARSRWQAGVVRAQQLPARAAKTAVAGEGVQQTLRESLVRERVEQDPCLVFRTGDARERELSDAVLFGRHGVVDPFGSLRKVIGITKRLGSPAVYSTCTSMSQASP